MWKQITAVVACVAVWGGVVLTQGAVALDVGVVPGGSRVEVDVDGRPMGALLVLGWSLFGDAAAEVDVVVRAAVRTAPALSEIQTAAVEAYEHRIVMPTMTTGETRTLLLSLSEQEVFAVANGSSFAYVWVAATYDAGGTIRLTEYCGLVGLGVDTALAVTECPDTGEPEQLRSCYDEGCARYAGWVADHWW